MINAGEVGKLKHILQSVFSLVLALSVLAGGRALLPEALGYQPPEFLDAAFHPEAAVGNDRVRIDLSCLSQGYVAVSALSEMRLKFQVVKDEEAYNYDLSSDGTPAIFPLQSGNGTYRFRVMENVVDKKYSELYSVTGDAFFPDEFQPFLRPSTYVSYSRDSECVRLAAELAQAAPDRLEFVKSVYSFVCDRITYDREKAASVQSGYLPNPDETLRTGKGICFDYAALAAAMLRSQGIPTKMIFGYVAPQNLYHAWNMFYTEQSGWMTVSFEVRGDNWNRIDLTFSANGADDAFIGDGSHYAEVYSY